MRFDDIIGNTPIKIQLGIASKAAKIQNSSVPHTLFAGAAGCGKTSMSKALANDLASKMIKVPPESIRTSNDVLELAEKLSVEGYTRDGRVVGIIRPTIVFLDEVHKVPLSGQEALGIAMEEWYIAVKNRFTKEINEFWLPRFTLVGATTESGKLSKPFRDRFKLIFHFTTYSEEESIAIVLKHAELKGINLSKEAALDIARRSRGVPRIMVSYLERVSDAMTVIGEKTINEEAAIATFNIMGVDKTGLLDTDIKILKCLYQSGIPIGVETLGVITNESEDTIQKRHEPYLIQRGLIIRTGRGRMITQKGIEYLRDNGHIENNRRFSLG